MLSVTAGSARRGLCSAGWRTQSITSGRWTLDSFRLSYQLRSCSSRPSSVHQLQSDRQIVPSAASSVIAYFPRAIDTDERRSFRAERVYASRLKRPRARSPQGILSLVLIDSSDRNDHYFKARRPSVRFFSSGGKEPSEEEAQKLKTKILKQTLSVAAKNNVEDFVAGSLASTMQPIEKTTAELRRRYRESEIIQENDRDYYNQITELQSLKKEAALQKTATNVYRALCGNVIICLAKLGAWASSGSSSMLSEFIHSVVDCGNQALLLVGLQNSRNSADRRHPYGYGKSVYFWALVSALGTFFLGAGISMTHAIGDLMDPSLQDITWHVWSVLGLSFVIDGYVLNKTIVDILETKSPDVTYWKHFKAIRDPATLAVLLEDGAACLGIVIAMSGIALSSATGNAVFDGLAGVGISTLLGCMGLALVHVNHRFLLGTAVDRDITEGIGEILLGRRSIDGIGSVQSQWISSDTFSYKAEVDFDGTYLAAKLMPIYQHEFLQIKDSMDSELQVLLALYAEDVIRTVEREVRHVEAKIRQQYPGAEYIELEPMSRFSDQLAIYDDVETELRRVESAALDKYLKSLKREKASRRVEKAKETENNAQNK